jgi:hypothetical protein
MITLRQAMTQWPKALAFNAEKQAKKRPGEGSEKANYELIAFA